jgi:hypothetical protein
VLGNRTLGPRISLKQMFEEFVGQRMVET